MDDAAGKALFPWIITFPRHGRGDDERQMPVKPLCLLTIACHGLIIGSAAAGIVPESNELVCRMEPIASIETLGVNRGHLPVPVMTRLRLLAPCRVS